MKFSLSLTLSFILFITLVTISDCKPVLDIQHEKLFDGYRYKIVAANPEDKYRFGGGVSLGKTGDLNCPVTVLQSYKDADKGFQVQISILDISYGIITQEHRLAIRFMPESVPKCAESEKWLVYVDNITKKAFIGIGGPKNYPGKQIMNGTFGIREYKEHYKLVFCVNGPSNCSDIGRFDNHESGRRLNLPNNEPFEVGFLRTQ